MEPISVTGSFRVTNPNQITFYSSGPFRHEVTRGWVVSGLRGVTGDLVVTGVNELPDLWEFTFGFQTVENKDEQTGVTVTLKPPGSPHDSPEEHAVEAPVEEVPLRELNADVTVPSPAEDAFTEVTGRGFHAGSVFSLLATGPQDELLYSDSNFNFKNEFKQHTNSVMFHRSIPLGNKNTAYAGQTVQFVLYPKEHGDLLSNMYLKCTLPGGLSLINNVGRALIKQIDFMIDGLTVETICDDWYVIHDQIFLDADEQVAMNIAMNGNELIIPLEFFFCRRHSHGNKGRERLRNPYFPLCALKSQNIYINITFHPSSWWCSTLTDLKDVSLIVEEIELEENERFYYRNTPLRYIVSRVQRDAPGTTPRELQLTASYPVETLVWFFRQKAFETGTDYTNRYTYGYPADGQGIQLTFPSGTSSYLDVIQSTRLTVVNNNDLLNDFDGSLYYTFKQAMGHNLSIPSKSIYMYSFGLSPKEYNQGGYLDFSKVDSNTTKLCITFKPEFEKAMETDYTLYVYYYGYAALEFSGGYARMPFL